MDSLISKNVEIVLIELWDDHYYQVIVDGKTRFIPSVTTKLGIIDKPGLGRWRGDVGNREADLRLYDSQQRGKRLHWARETLLTGGVVIYDPWQKPVYTELQLTDLKTQYDGKVAILRTQDEMLQIHKLKRQLAILKPEIVGVEVKVYDLENNDAGTVDGIYRIKAGDYLINGSKPLHLEAGLYVEDFKSGGYLDDGVWKQLAPYGKMVEDRLGEEIVGALVTHTGVGKIKGGVPGLATKFRDRKTLMERDYVAYRHAAALWENDHADDEPVTGEFPSLITLGA